MFNNYNIKQIKKTDRYLKALYGVGFIDVVNFKNDDITDLRRNNLIFDEDGI